jgi:hypothetical protein
MASLFGARRRRSPEDDRSGDGRFQRRRLSPEEDAASPAGTSPGWLSSFVSGAKRVFSSVLLFSSPEEPASDGDDDDSVDGDDLASSEQHLLPLSPPRPRLTPCFSSLSRMPVLTVLGPLRILARVDALLLASRPRVSVCVLKFCW